MHGSGPGYRQLIRASKVAGRRDFCNFIHHLTQFYLCFGLILWLWK